MALLLPKVEERWGGITAIAVDAGKKSRLAVKWAADNILNYQNRRYCVLVHVRTTTSHPQDFDAEDQSRPPNTDQLEVEQLFLPYRAFCGRKGVEIKEVVLYENDVARALVDYIGDNCIDNIVVGASSKNALTRKFRNVDVPSTILKLAPESCAVFVVSKGKIQTSRSCRPPQRPISSSAAAAICPQLPETVRTTPPKPPIPIVAEDSRQPPTPTPNPTHVATILPTIPTSNAAPTPRNMEMSLLKFQNHQDFLPYLLPHTQHISSYSTTHDQKEESTFSSKTRTVTSRDGLSVDSLTHNSESYNLSEFSGPPSSISTKVSSELPITSQSSKDFSRPDPSEVEEEIRRLKLELKQSMEMYNSVCKEAVTARHMASELRRLHSVKAQKLQAAKLAEEAALSLAEMEKKKTKAAIEAAQMAQRLVEIEAQKRQNAERAIQKGVARKKSMESLTQHNVVYRRYTIEEIEVATDYFADSNKIGEGGYGPVYKASLGHTSVAVKVLRPDLSQGLKQFRKEVEVLSSIRHPHMVILLGACPEYGCLVYEYMEKGSLEDCLFRKGSTPSIPWRKRFQIASEIATGLLFLHETKPEPLVHRDLKPANILLDRNYVSKISDVGLARLVPPTVANSVTEYYCLTEAAGTFCYIDPEYQQTGKLGVKSDVYSLGVILLQLITAKNPMGLSHHVEQAIETGTFPDILDPSQTDWPLQDALSLAKLALRCCELRKKDRPNLASVVLPELSRLRDLALADEANQSRIMPPSSTQERGSCHTGQIYVKEGWLQQRIKMTMFWSFKASDTSGSKKAVTVSGSQANRTKKMADKMKKFQAGCSWSSFAGCASSSNPNAPIQRFRSFS